MVCHLCKGDKRERGDLKNEREKGKGGEWTKYNEEERKNKNDVWFSSPMRSVARSPVQRCKAAVPTDPSLLRWHMLLEPGVGMLHNLFKAISTIDIFMDHIF